MHNVQYYIVKFESVENFCSKMDLTYRLNSCVQLKLTQLLYESFELTYSHSDVLAQFAGAAIQDYATQITFTTILVNDAFTITAEVMTLLISKLT